MVCSSFCFFCIYDALHILNLWYMRDIDHLCINDPAVSMDFGIERTIEKQGTYPTAHFSYIMFYGFCPFIFSLFCKVGSCSLIAVFTSWSASCYRNWQNSLRSINKWFEKAWEKFQKKVFVTVLWTTFTIKALPRGCVLSWDCSDEQKNIRGGIERNGQWSLCVRILFLPFLVLSFIFIYLFLDICQLCF